MERGDGVNKPVGDDARKGAVKKRTQFKTRLGGVTAWTKRSKTSGEFMAVKKPAVTAKKFKGGRREKHQQKEATDRRWWRLIPSDKTKEAAGKNGPSTGEG